VHNDVATLLYCGRAIEELLELVDQSSVLNAVPKDRTEKSSEGAKRQLRGDDLAESLVLTDQGPRQKRHLILEHCEVGAHFAESDEEVIGQRAHDRGHHPLPRRMARATD